MASHSIQVRCGNISDKQQSGRVIPGPCTAKCVVTNDTWNCVMVAMYLATFMLITTLVRLFIAIATTALSEDFIIHDLPETSQKKVYIALIIAMMCMEPLYFLYPICAQIKIMRIFVHLRNYRQSSAVPPNIQIFTRATAYWWQTCRCMYSLVRRAKFVPILNMIVITVFVCAGFMAELQDGQSYLNAHKRICLPLMIAEVMNFGIGLFCQREVKRLEYAILEMWYQQKKKNFIACTDDNWKSMVQLLRSNFHSLPKTQKIRLNPEI
ncbi:uncharacterized protein LOC129602550 [Paramacrobiotus metropolitanus]|uniref:uncharacterized protein LOC129602550 n=1 Tax=Paramacrobiotus metropolitanus TaxID=2943436 RepID=UPI00244577FE|nr:uncharacterized protein LOC129602550 [Paramacrobiotus metropolitanus]